MASSPRLRLSLVWDAVYALQKAALKSEARQILGKSSGGEPHRLTRLLTQLLFEVPGFSSLIVGHVQVSYLCSLETLGLISEANIVR